MRWVVMMALAGCYGPVLPTGAPCATESDCPPPLVCDLGHCQREHSTDIDASLLIDTPADIPVDTLSVIDGNLGCSCVSPTMIQCDSDPAMTCALGCVTQNGGARCATVAPSNGVPETVAGVNGLVTISARTSFDTVTGEITGGVIRAPGEGVIGGIGFALRTFGTTQLGVFTMDRLVVGAGVTVFFTGSRSAVFVVATDATITGTIDLSGSCMNDRSCPGPGGGVGATTMPAGGCGAGAMGQRDPNAITGADGGGGGGGGGAVGGGGGNAGTFLGGMGGSACLVADNEPLVGGSGGGGGGAGASVANPPFGGGGGGAFQLTALDRITITGTITARGTGGGGGFGAAGNAAAGSGGGAGGAILVEAPVVELVAGSVLAANGGGGGGGGLFNTTGSPGQDGQASAQPANGGAGAGASSSTGRGGAGGAGTSTAGTAGNIANNLNAGGGGGAVGRVYVRSLQLTNGGVTSPPAGTGALRTH